MDEVNGMHLYVYIYIYECICACVCVLGVEFMKNIKRSVTIGL